MRRLPFFILAYVALGLQIGAGEYLKWADARPNLVLVAALFLALYLPRDAALLGCFSLGLVQDLVSQHPPGLYALSYGLTAMFVSPLTHVVNRDHPLTHLGLAAAGGFVTAVVLALHAWFRTSPGATVRGPLAPLFAAALYTAVLAPAVLWGLLRFRRVFAFPGGHRRGWR